jgi:ABC-2 type transport system ATP-binding protein
VEYAVDIQGVTKTFGPKVAVHDLDLRVRQGSLCGFLGPNGAGKTTTIRMIMSIIFPDRGDIRVLGRNSALESKDRIGYLPEERGVYRKMKVAAFLNYMGRLKGLDAGPLRRKVDEWLARVELADAARKKCEELSKGMQQKIQFIASVIHEPDLIILDEPFSGLDPVNRKLLRSLIDEQHRAGRTIIFSTHAMYEAEQLCDHLFMIHRGVKVLDDTLEGIRAAHDPRTVLVEVMSGSSTPPVIDAEDGEPHVSSADLSWSPKFRSIEGVVGVTPGRHGLELHLKERADPLQVMRAAMQAAPLRRCELKRVDLEDVFISLVEAAGEEAPSREELRTTNVTLETTSG